MKAAILYCRVSTEDQADNYSIPTQREAMQEYASEHNMEILKDFTDPGISGSTLDRPALTELREFVQNSQVNAVIAYDPDRLSRNFVHLMVLANEFEQAKVELHFITQQIGNTPEDKMLFGMKGLFAEYERTKIAERTLRGIKQRARLGKIPIGGSGKLFGYNYIVGRGDHEGERYINETEAQWVREIYRWLIEDGLTVNQIVYRLRSLGVPTPSGKSFWNDSTVRHILKNRAYMGDTVYFEIKIPGVSPPIISKKTFEAAQVKLYQNKRFAKRNAKRNYLLSGFVFCSRCGRRYRGKNQITKSKRKVSYTPHYQCPKRDRIVSPTRCVNRMWNANILEGKVWEEVRTLLLHPSAIRQGMKTLEANSQRKNSLEQEVGETIKRLKSLDREQDQLLQWAMKGFPKDTIERENQRINQDRAELENHRVVLEAKIDTAKQSKVNFDSIENFCALTRENINHFTFAEKRLALEALDIKVWVDSEKIDIEGAIPIVKEINSNSPFCVS